MNPIFRTITELSDPILPSVIELYQSAFPIEEQMYASFFWKMFDQDSRRHLEVAEQNEKLSGFIVWDEPAETGEAGYIWYLAVDEDKRGKGLGEALYNRAVSAVKACGAPAVMYEVELPSEAEQRHGSRAKKIARIRIDWYRKLGASTLDGVNCQCDTDWQSPMPMQPMIHRFDPKITPQQAFAWGVKVIADGKPEWFVKTGELKFGNASIEDAHEDG